MILLIHVLRFCILLVQASVCAVLIVPLATLLGCFAWALIRTILL